MFALLLPVLITAIGAAIDFGYLYSKKTSLQGAADASALAAASELRLASRSESEIAAIAETTALANLKDMTGKIGINVQISSEPPLVSVEISQSPRLYFMDQIRGNTDSQIKARANARIAGQTPICLLALDDAQGATLKVNKDARITGNRCAVHSNSTSSSGIRVHRAGRLDAELICSTGGVDGGKKSFGVPPLMDCPAMDDPLIKRSPPPIGGCDYKRVKIGGGSQSLKPGTYCGGLAVGGSARVHLDPGIYVIQDGPLSIGGKAELNGKGVGFFLTGSGATLRMGPRTEIELSAPTSGPLTGILFFEDPNNGAGKHSIRSNGARELVGTFYLPNSSLTIDATKPIFDKSAYTILIVNTLDMFSGPNLVLNSDYDQSDVPVPHELEDVGIKGDKVVLVK